jgi:hypothetical protein
VTLPICCALVRDAIEVTADPKTRAVVQLARVAERRGRG